MPVVRCSARQAGRRRCAFVTLSAHLRAGSAGRGLSRSVYRQRRSVGGLSQSHGHRHHGCRRVPEKRSTQGRSSRRLAFADGSAAANQRSGRHLHAAMGGCCQRQGPSARCTVCHALAALRRRFQVDPGSQGLEGVGGISRQVADWRGCRSGTGPHCRHVCPLRAVRTQVTNTCIVSITCVGS